MALILPSNEVFFWGFLDKYACVHVAKASERDQISRQSLERGALVKMLDIMKSSKTTNH